MDDKGFRSVCYTGNTLFAQQALYSLGGRDIHAENDESF
jgi:hypothetical protein